MNATLTSNTLKKTITAMFLGLAIGLPSLGNGAAIAQPDLTAKKTFVASDPYVVNVNGTNTTISLAGKPRAYDFVSNPLVNPNTGVADAATLMATNPNGYWFLNGPDITNSGIQGHIEKQSGRLVLGTLVGDMPTAGGKCRAQVASFAVPNRKKVYWDMIVQLGSADHPWELTAPGKSPVLITQVKADNAPNPGISIFADTDPNTPNRLVLSFSWRGGKAPTCINVGKYYNVTPNVPVRIVMEAFLDERENANGGQGYWRVWVNGSLAVTLDAPTLSSLFNNNGTPTVHTWNIAAYMFNDVCPNLLSRFTYWSRAKMLVD